MSGRAVVLILLALAVISGWGTWRWISARNAAIDRVGVQQARLTPPEDGGEDWREIPNLPSREIFYRVTLTSAPLGQKLQYHCDWLDPQGQLALRRDYQTQTVTSEIWKVYCRADFTPASAPGPWTVEMYLLKRKISTTSFQITRGEPRR